MSHPTFANGKICYIQIPAVDVQASVAFYQKEITALISDPVGNVFGLYQHRG